MNRMACAFLLVILLSSTASAQSVGYGFSGGRDIMFTTDLPNPLSSETAEIKPYMWPSIRLHCTVLHDEDGCPDQAGTVAWAKRRELRFNELERENQSLRDALGRIRHIILEEADNPTGRPKE